MNTRDKKEKKEKKEKKSEKKHEKKTAKSPKKDPMQFRPLLPKDSLLVMELRAKLANRAQNGVQPHVSAVTPAGAQVSYDSASFPMGQKALNALMEAKKKNELENEKKVNRSKTLTPKMPKKSEIEKSNALKSTNLLHFVDLTYATRPVSKKPKKGDEWQPTPPLDGNGKKKITFQADDINETLALSSSPSTSGGDGWLSDKGDPSFVPEEYDLLSSDKCVLGDFGSGDSNKRKHKAKEKEKEKEQMPAIEKEHKSAIEKQIQTSGVRADFDKKRQKRRLERSGLGTKDIKDKMHQAIIRFEEQQASRRRALAKVGTVSRNLKELTRPRSTSLPAKAVQFAKRVKHLSMPETILNFKSLSLLYGSLISPGSKHLLWNAKKKESKPTHLDDVIAEMKLKKKI